MPNFIDLTGQRFGRLVAVERAPNDGRRTIWSCVCDCGAQSRQVADSLRGGRVVSCGCARAERVGRLRLKHGKSETVAFSRWSDMLRRCYDPKNKSFPNYGARGIAVCPEWRESFAQFHADMGDPPPGMWLERVDNDGPYSKANCVWASRAVQSRNKRTSRIIEAHGERLTLSEWARRIGLDHRTISGRLARGWPADKALVPTLYQTNGLPR